MISSLIIANQKRWIGMKTNPARAEEFHDVAIRLLNGKPRYQAIAATTNVPWFVIAVIHEREADGDFTKQLGQGDPLNEVSKHIPQGRGPWLPYPGDTDLFNAFQRCAVDALRYCNPYPATWKDWTPGGALTLLEEYNGLGYAVRGVPSAYVWSGSNQYVSGKYVADHVYRQSAVDVQLGCAPLIYAMMQIDRSIGFDKPLTS